MGKQQKMKHKFGAAKYISIPLLLNMFTLPAHADGQYYWWNQGGFNCLGQNSPGGPSFNTNSLEGTVSLTIQRSIETNAAYPYYCLTLLSLEPNGSSYYDEYAPLYPWTIPVRGQTGAGGGYRFFDDVIRIKGLKIDPKNTGSTCNSVGNPINPSIGNKFELVKDYVDDFKSTGLSFERIYNSTSLYVSHGIGWGWTHLFSARLTLSPSKKIVSVARSDGKILLFKFLNGTWLPDTDINDRLLQLVDASGVITGWRYIVAHDNSSELYDTAGRLLSITDRAGQIKTLTYSDATTPLTVAPSAGLLIRVTDALGRQLNFVYATAGRIIKMTDPAGGIFTYGYDANNNLSSVTYPDGKSKQYLYENTTFIHALTGILDENGARYATWSYDALGRAITSEHSVGVEKVTLTYNVDGSASITDALGTTRTQTFQVVQGVVKSGGQSQPGGSGCAAAASNFTYDANGNVASRSDFNGTKTCYAYDLARNLETVRLEGVSASTACPANLATYTPSTVAGSAERKFSTQWNQSFRLPTQIAEPLRITTYTYDAKGNVLSKTVQPTADSTGALGLAATAAGSPRIDTYTYNTVGQVLTADGPRTDAADITTYTYDAQGNLAGVSNALNQATTLGGYDANGRPGTLTDPNGLLTTLIYDVRGRLTSRSTGGETTSYTYDGVGQLLSVTAPSGARYNYSYDAAHRLSDIADSTGNHIHYTLDAMGNRTKEEAFDSAGVVIQTHSRVFDALNRLWKDIGAVNQTTTYAYDANGNLTGITDALNRQSSRSYDALNRLISSTDAANGVTRYGYDGLDQLVQVTDPKNLVTQYQRDGLGNLQQQTSPDTGVTANTYDAAGNVLTRTDAKGQIASYSYDALNRLVGISYVGSPAQAVSYQYDQGTNGIGHLTGLTDATGVTSYSYDQHGRLTGETHQSHGAIYTTAYGYDAQGRLSGITYPSGRTVNYSFDGMGRISQVATSFNGTSKVLASGIVYQPFGGVSSFTFGDGQTAPIQRYTRQRDQDGRVASYTLNGKALSIGYDAASQIAFVSDPLNLANTANYSYDPLSRLTSYTQNTTSQNFGYDADGNRLSQTLGSTTSNYSYVPGSNKLSTIQTGATTQSLTQDANGATTSDASRQYGYDVRGRLIQATTAQGIINYEVNALGLRVRKQVPYSNSDILYHYDLQGHLIGESLTGTTQFNREYIYLGDQPVAVMQ